MAQKPYVPEDPSTVYVTEKLPPPRAWYANRPGEVAGDPDHITFGDIGPDTGYLGQLVPLFRDRLIPGAADRADVVAAGEALAARRAAGAGRGPIIEDLEAAFLILGVLEGTPGDWTRAGSEIAARIDGVRFSAHKANAVAEAAPAEWLALKPAAIRDKLAGNGPDTLLAGFAADAHH